MLIAGVADHLAGGEGEDVGAAVPLLAFLDPLVVRVAAGDRLEVHADAAQTRHQVLHRTDLRHLAALEPDEDRLVVVGVEDQRRVDQAGVAVDQREGHVQMDERLGLTRQLLHQDIVRLRPGGEVREQEVDRLRAGARADTYDQHVVPGDQHVAAFEGDLRAIGVEPRRVQGLRAQLGVELEDGLHDERLATTHLARHLADQHALADGHRRVPREEEVVQRRQAETLGTQEAGEVVAHQRDALDQAAGDLRRFEVAQRVRQLGHVLLAADALGEGRAGEVVLHDVRQEVPHEVGAGTAGEHALELVVFLDDDGLVENVAVERTLRRGRRHV